FAPDSCDPETEDCGGDDCDGPNPPPECGDDDNLTVIVNGDGEVTGSLPCSNTDSPVTPQTCSRVFSNNTDISLLATKGNSAISFAWSGDCSGTSPTCNIDNMTTNKTVTITFTSDIEPIDDIFEFGTCTKVNGVCVMTINCDVVPGCQSAVVYSNPIQIVHKDPGIAADYSAFFPTEHDQFDFVACNSAAGTGSGSCTSLGSQPSQSGTFYLRVLKKANQLPGGLAASVRVLATLGAISDQHDGRFVFINSGGGQ
ncbi:MAG: hypothetical protein AAB821_02415, partial [Patescibacteria group bacterium]